MMMMMRIPGDWILDNQEFTVYCYGLLITHVFFN
jgi:hypothetical protein